jgi:hypothetical protein
VSAASDALLEGFGALLEFGGERLTYDDAEVIAVVNRGPSKLRDSIAMSGPGRKPDFSVLGMTTIELLKTAMTSTPAAGGIFIDAEAGRHRVKAVENRGNTWFCHCEPYSV